MAKQTHVSLALIAIVAFVSGCSDAGDETPQPQGGLGGGVGGGGGMLPTGPPPEMDPPDMAAGGTGGVGGAGAGGIGAGGMAGGGAGGTTGGMGGAGGEPPDAGVDSGMDDGPLNMAPVTFGTNVKVSDASNSSQQTEVLLAARASDGLLFAGWVDNRQSPSRCGYSVSKDGGLTWGANFFASTQGSGGAFAGDPALAIDDAGNLYAGCQDYASGGLGTNYILLSHSKDDGATWSEQERVHQSLDKPWLGGSGDGTVLLTWLGNPGGMKRSTDYGATWADPISLGFINHGTTVSFSNSDLVHVAYNTGEDTVTYRRSKDNGVTFEPARDLADQGRPCRSPCSPRSHPIVGADTDPSGQVVAITWASRLDGHPDAEGDDDVFVIVSYDGGDTFSDPMRVNDNQNPSRQFQSWAAVDKYGAVHIVWSDLRDGDNSTYYARMTDIDQGFEPNVKVNDDAGDPPGFLGDYKGIDIVGRDVVVIWQDTRNDSGDIYFARAKDAAAAGGPLMQ